MAVAADDEVVKSSDATEDSSKIRRPTENEDGKPLDRRKDERQTLKMENEKYFEFWINIYNVLPTI